MGISPGSDLSKIHLEEKKIMKNSLETPKSVPSAVIYLLTKIFYIICLRITDKGLLVTWLLEAMGKGHVLQINNLKKKRTECSIKGTFFLNYASVAFYHPYAKKCRLHDFMFKSITSF